MLKMGLKKWAMRLKRGDRSAFLPFYERTAPGLLRFLIWKTGGNKPLAEDVLQETYVRFLLNLDRIESVKDVAVHAYILRIAKNCLVDKVGRTPQAKRTHVPLDTIGELTAENANSPESAVELRELSIAMEALPEKEREIIWLRDALGYSHREVADQIGLTEQASRQAYVRAKKSLMAELSDKWFPIPQGGQYATAEMP